MTWVGNKVYQLLDYGINNGDAFLPNTKFSSKLAEECYEFFRKDYICITIDNSKGALCSTYPLQIIIPLQEKQGAVCTEDIDKELFKEKVLQSLGGRFARTRGRFPVPVLLFRNKSVCRSSTLACSAEIYSRSGYDYIMRGETSVKPDNDQTKHSVRSSTSSNTLHTNRQSNQDLVCYNNNIVSLPQPGLCQNETTRSKRMHRTQQVTTNSDNNNKEWLLDKVRKADIKLLKTFKVDVVCDLMVENKKVKFGVNVTSSEKVDSKNRYRDFKLFGIPYPGCEFFVDYMQNNYTGAGLQFNWNQTFVDAGLQVCDSIFQVSGVNWKNYMQWDLVKLTQNYLKLVLQCLVGQQFSGLLLHCISGWDRTPLFISLLRLSLWADGVIHQSLSADEIVYLTLAYDWLLFSHQLYDRVHKNEEILHFCFEFLKDITAPEYSVLSNMNSSESLSSASPAAESKMCDVHNLAGQSEIVTNAKTLHDIDQFAILTANSEFEVSHQENDIVQTENSWQNGYLNEYDKLLLNPDDAKPSCTCANETHYGDDCSFQSENVIGAVAVDHQDHNKPTILLDSNPAILPLNSDANFSRDLNPLGGNGNHANNKKSASQNQNSRSTVRTNKTDAFPNFQVATSSEMMFDEAVSNSETNARSLTKTKSMPITISSDHHPEKATCTNGNDEPGTSWQMVPPLHQDEALFASDTTYNSCFKQNANHELSHTNSTPLSRNVEHSCNPTTETELKAKFQRRKDRLEAARNIMLPIYSAVVQKQRKKQESTGLAAALGAFVHFVKRS